MKALVLAISVLVAASLPAAAQKEDIFGLSVDEELRIQRGEVIVHMERANVPAKRAMVVGLVDASAEQTYRVYTDFDNYRAIFGITRSEVVKREGNTVYGRFVLDFPWPLGQRWTYNETTLRLKRHALSFKRHDGSFRVYEGSLRVLSEGPSRSRVIYQARIDPDLPVPVWMLGWAQSQVFPNVIHCVRQAVSTGGFAKAKAP